jgi:hypothetical protein
MKFKIFYIFIYLFLNINSIQIKVNGNNFFSFLSKIGEPNLNIPLTLTTSFDKIIYIQNNYINSYNYNKSSSAKKLNQKFHSNYSYLTNDYNIELEAINDNIQMLNQLINLNIGHAKLPDLTNALTIPYLGFFGLGKMDKNNKNLNLMEQLKSKNIISKKIIYFQSTSSLNNTRNIFLGEFPNDITTKLKSMKCKTNKNYEYNRVCNLSHIAFNLRNYENLTKEIIKNNSIYLNTQIEFTYDNSLYTVIPISYKEYFEKNILNYGDKCTKIDFYLYPTWKCKENIFIGIHFIINDTLIDVTSSLIDLKGLPFFTILFREGIDRIQIPIPVLNYNYFKVLIDDDEESVTLLSDQNILPMPEQ